MEEKDFKIADSNADEKENEETSEKTDSSADNSVMKQDKTRNHLREHSFATDSLSEKRSRKSLKTEDDEFDVSDKSEKKKRRKSEKSKVSEGTSVNDDSLKADESSEIPKGDDKKPDKSEKKVQKLEKKSEKKKRRLELARKKLPKQTVYNFRRVYSEEKQKNVTKLVKEEVVKPAHKPETLVSKGAKSVTNKVKSGVINGIHSEISKYEDENQTLKAAHMTERAAESALRYGQNSLKKANSKLKEQPYKKVSKLKMNSERAESKLSFHKAVTENNAMKKNESTAVQKKTIKKAQQKAHQKKNAVKTKAAADRAVKVSEEITRKIVTAIAHNKVAIVVMIIFFVLIIMIQLFGGALCSSLADTGTAVIATSFTSEDEDIRKAEEYMKSRETSTLDFVNNISNWYIGWNEYNISTCSMDHDPYKLIAYLSAKNMNFKYDDHTRNLIDEIFNELYTVNIEDVREIRTEEHEEINEEGAAVTVITYYEYCILNVSVTARDWDSVVIPKLEAANVKDLYDLLYDKKGNKPTLF